MPRPLVTPREVALHRRYVHHVLAPGRRGTHCGPQPRQQNERRHAVTQLHLKQFQRVDLVDRLHPAVGVDEVGQQPTGVDGGTVDDPVRGGRTGGQGQRHQRVCGGLGTLSQRQGMGMQLAGIPHRRNRNTCSGAAERRLFCVNQGRVGARAAADRLGGIVDQNVQRSLRGNFIGETSHLGRITQVDTHDAQPVEPTRRIGQLGESARRVPRESGGDREAGTVAQQHQGDVHADLGAATGQHGPSPGQVRALITPGPVGRRTIRTQLVVECIDLGVSHLADVAMLGTPQRPDRVSTTQRQAGRLVIDPIGRSGRGGPDHRTVGFQLRLARLAAALPLENFE